MGVHYFPVSRKLLIGGHKLRDCAGNVLPTYYYYTFGNVPYVSHSEETKCRQRVC
jgi:hypothetical protein